MRPKSLTTCFTTALISSLLLRSAVYARATLPAPCCCSFTWAAVSSLGLGAMSTQASRQPWRARVSDSVRPRPPAAPVSYTHQEEGLRDYQAHIIPEEVPGFTAPISWLHTPGGRVE